MPKPEKKFVSGGIEASVFENQIQKDGKTFNIKKVAFQKRYKSSDGSWKGTGSLDISDIPKAILVLSKAYEYLVLNSESPEKVDFEGNGSDG